MNFFQGCLGNSQKIPPVTIAKDSQIIKKLICESVAVYFCELPCDQLRFLNNRNLTDFFLPDFRR